MLAAVTAPLCFVVGAVCARLFIQSMRSDQIGVLLSRQLAATGPTAQSFDKGSTLVATAPTAMHERRYHYPTDEREVSRANDADDNNDDEYSEGFDADDIAQATSRAAAVQHAMQRRVEQRRTETTLKSVGGDPSLVRSIVAASKAKRAHLQRGRTPPLKR